MPCYDPRDRPISYEKNQQDIEEARATLTKLLCYACRLLIENKIEVGFELHSWWDMHQRDDAFRVESDRREAEREVTATEKREYLNSIRDRLRKQLTPEEMEAVGLKS